jgi:hypothetical protein
MRGVAGDEQPALSPALRDERVKEINRGALKLRFLGRYPSPQQLPDFRRTCDCRTVFVGEDGDLPATTIAGTTDVGRGTVRIAELDRMIAKLWLLSLEQNIDHEPAFVEAVVFHLGLDEPAHQRTRPVTAHDVFGADAMNLPAAHILIAQVDMIFAILDQKDIAAAANCHVAASAEAGAKNVFQIGLVDAIAAVPALCADVLGTRPIEQQVSRTVDKAHSRIGARD